jgi:hypothetical protein
MVTMVKDLLKVKYIRNPCKRCLVDPMCKENCYKLKNHEESKITIYTSILSSLIGINVFLCLKYFN